MQDTATGPSHPQEDIHIGKPLSLWAKTISVTLLVLMTAAAIGFVWVMSSLPRIEGVVPLRGMELPATVTRDHSGLPHITARSTHDAYFSMGWVHAQDRLWQMELQRRVGQGRLAELIGEKGLANDRFMRTLGLSTLADAAVEKQDKATRDALNAYAEGVNAWLDQHWHRLPPEFLALHYIPEHWKPADSLVTARLFALQLTNNWRDELLRAKLAARLDGQQMNDLWPATDGKSSPVTLGMAPGTLVDPLPSWLAPRQASNAWVVAGNRSATGKPLLANDPHLALSAPIQWYLLSVEAPGVTSSGGTVPGIPFHLVGHNGRIAWGLTSTGADTVDFFLEKPVGDDAYQTPRGTEPFRHRQEIIKVRGADDQVLDVRLTRHGPVISGLLPAKSVDGDVLVSVRATALEEDDLTPQAFLRMNRAVDWRGFSAAIRDLSLPVLNLTYADTTGTIAFAVAGKIPLRKGGNGAVPARGWLDEGEWTGWIPADKLPQQINPKTGMLVNANNRVSGERYPYLLASQWPDGSRAQRIGDLLAAKPVLSMDDMAAIQMDTVSLPALRIKPILGVPANLSPLADQAARMIAAWDGDMAANRPEPLIFQAWTDEVWRSLFSPILGDDYPAYNWMRPDVLVAVLKNGRAPWCGDQDAGGCPAKVAAALERAVSALAARHGQTLSNWRWGDEHQATFNHTIFNGVPILNRISDFSAPTGGDDFTISRGSYRRDTPFQHIHGSGMRAVFDLSDLANSRFIIATGQSGNPLSRHYDDLLPAWLTNRGMHLGRRSDMNAVLSLEPGY